MIVTIAEPIYFGGVNILSVPGWMTTGLDTFRYPKRDVSDFPLAHSNKSVTTSAFYKGKPVNVRGVIRLSGREALDDALSTLRKILEPINQTLQLPISGNQRRYLRTTVNNIAISNVNGGYAEVDIEFTTSDPYNYGIITTEVLNVINLTSGNKSYPVTFEGTANQAPVITYTLDSFTNGSNRTVTFSDPQGNSISVQRTWVANEVLVIDCANRTVQVDGTDVDFTGNFPEWLPGLPDFINYTDDFTARQVDINVTYTKRYL